jgi:hypothetical protein
MAVWRSRCAPNTRGDVSGARKVCVRAAGKRCAVWCDELLLHSESITRCVLVRDNLTHEWGVKVFKRDSKKINQTKKSTKIAIRTEGEEREEGSKGWIIGGRGFAVFSRDRSTHKNVCALLRARVPKQRRRTRRTHHRKRARATPFLRYVIGGALSRFTSSCTRPRLAILRVRVACV